MKYIYDDIKKSAGGQRPLQKETLRWTVTDKCHRSGYIVLYVKDKCHKSGYIVLYSQGQMLQKWKHCNVQSRTNATEVDTLYYTVKDKCHRSGYIVLYSQGQMLQKWKHCNVQSSTNATKVDILYCTVKDKCQCSRKHCFVQSRTNANAAGNIALYS